MGKYYQVEDIQKSILQYIFEVIFSSMRIYMIKNIVGEYSIWLRAN